MGMARALRRRPRRRAAPRRAARPSPSSSPATSSSPGPDLRAQGPGAGLRRRARADLQQAPDPRPLPQPGLFRLRRLRLRGRLAALFRQAGRAPHPARGGHAGGDDEIAHRLRSRSSQPDRSAERTRLVLDAMVETGAITSGAAGEGARPAPEGLENAPTAPARSISSTGSTARRRKTSGPLRADLIVETTLDLPSREPPPTTAAASIVERFAHAGVEPGRAGRARRRRARCGP